jgi:hypothetical protein
VKLLRCRAVLEFRRERRLQVAGGFRASILMQVYCRARGPCSYPAWIGNALGQISKCFQLSAISARIRHVGMAIEASEWLLRGVLS